MKKLILLAAVLYVGVAPAALRELRNASEFQELIQTSLSPVVVQFSAYWCGPCQRLASTLRQVSHNYTDRDVILAKVDAYVNSSLGSYLMGGYPTVRTFNRGSVTGHSFVGAKSSAFVNNFIDGLIQGSQSNGWRGVQAGPFCPVQ